MSKSNPQRENALYQEWRNDRIAELELAHDKAIGDGISIVKGRDDRIAELEAHIKRHNQWFSENLATHRAALKEQP